MTHRTRYDWWRGWLPLVVGPTGVMLSDPTAGPRWAAMWLLAVAVFVGCKWLTWRRTPTGSAARQLGYLVAWPGLDAVAFLGPRRAPPPSAGEWAFAAGKLGLGVALVFAAGWVPADRPYLVGWVSMAGIVFVLHFGLFHLLSCGWRRAGVVAKPLMHGPAAATSLSDFWGRRWNTAFRDLTHRFLFRPLTPRVGGRGAVLVGFLVSGLVHDAVISWPAGGGYGGPTLFFLVQAAGLLVERAVPGLRGRLFTAVVVLAPAPLLFHRPFVVGVVVPFLHALGVA